MPKIIYSGIILWITTLFFLFTPPSTNADWQLVSDDPVIPVGPDGSWDDYIVSSPSVFFNGTNFEMWYAGHDGLNWRIGYASSPNGIVWTKNSDPIIDSIDNQENINVHNPRVLFKDGVYKMWFTSSNQAANNFHINYIESEFGDDWKNSIPVLNVLSSTEDWENGRGISDPSIIYEPNQNLYKMWYAGNDSSDHWRIGFASSAYETINWTKSSTFILEGKNSWTGEGFSIANPNILVEKEVYHMFYHGEKRIGHAVLIDSIGWEKDLHPLFESDDERVVAPYVMEHNGKYYLYYTAINNNKIQIYLRISDKLSSSPTTTPTTTPTFTPTVTPTITNTPTPTITITLTPTPTPPPPSSPIILIPGLGASWNPNDIFSCSLASSGTWQLAPYVSLYNRLIKTLTNNAHLQLNKDLYVYGYDWRQPLDVQGNRLKNFIDGIASQKPAGTKFKIVGHSLGGLVGRSYVTNNPNSHKIDKIITVGSPHEGSVLAYPLWENGEVWTDDRIVKLAVTQLVKYCRFLISDSFPPKTEREVLQSMVPSVKSILPLFDYLKQKGQTDTIPTSGLKNQNDWLLSHKFQFSSTFPSQSLTTLSGNGTETLRYLQVVNPSPKDLSSGNWIDGKPVKREKNKEGDGSVLNLSSRIDGADDKIIRGNHGDIISSDQAIREILKFLGLPDVQPAEKLIAPEETAGRTLAISVDQPAELRLVDPRKKTSQSADNIIVFFQPATGLYKLRINPTETVFANLHIALFDEAGYDEKFVKLKMTKNKPVDYLLVYNSKSVLPKIIPL